MKRVFDFVVAGVGLVVLSPLLLVIALAVKLSSPGPVLFRQKRVGFGGKGFWMLKFRSMRVDAEETGPSITQEGDTRVTRIGRLLRKTKLDELPQLWNVVVGEMSLVGPRPEVPEYVLRYTAKQRRVLQLKPGITSPATLEFRNEEEMLREEIGAAESAADWERVENFYVEYCMPRKIELNLEYAERASLWQDFLIILRTVFPFHYAHRRKRS